MPFRFVNLDGSEPHSLGPVLRWALLDRVLGKRRTGPVGSPAPRVEPDPELLRAPPAIGAPARLTWLGHASWLVQLDGVSLLLDPVLSHSIGPGISRYVAPGVSRADLPRIDAQLVSHNHRDHLDLPSLRAVASPVIAGLGLRSFFAGVGLECTELPWWSEAQVGAVTVRFVPSQH